jgi:hypothetical protein
MPFRVKLLLVVLSAAGVGAFVVAGLLGSGSSGACNQPAAIDRLIPGCDESVLRQAQVGVDMAPGFTAELTINGTPIPKDQLQSIGIRSDPSKGVAPDTFVFVPGDGKAIEGLEPQQNCATVRYWSLADGEDSAKTYSWCFRAA